jgi:hypothetical protein
VFRALPGQGHGVLSTEYDKRRLEDFLSATWAGRSKIGIQESRSITGGLAGTTFTKIIEAARKSDPIAHKKME